MKTAGLLGISLIFLLVITFASAVSPQTLVVGKVYDKIYGSSGLSGVSVEIDCKNGYWKGTSASNGDYGANLNTADCTDGDSMTVKLSKSGYNSKTFTNPSISTISAGTDKLLIVNFVMILETSTNPEGNSGGGGNSRCTPSFWDCPEEWTECVNGVQTRICSSNCGTDKTETQGCLKEFLNEDEFLTDEQGEGFFSTITGAVIGLLGTGGTVLIIVFVLAVAGAIIFVRFRKKK